MVAAKQRYLREESDTSYQVLMDEVRFDMVESYLRDSNIPMTQQAAEFAKGPSIGPVPVARLPHVRPCRYRAANRGSGRRSSLGPD